MPKPTFRTIADLAGVGTATVERVLNGRGGVRPDTAARVILAARKLDWPGRIPEQHRGLLRIEVLLVRPDTSFFARLARAFRRISVSLDKAIQVQVTFTSETDHAAVARQIRAPARPRAALVIAAADAPEIRAALQDAVAGGLPVVQVVTRSLPDADFVGIDNYSAGRTAALMMARMCRGAGTVLALCHSPQYEVHRARLRGFSDYLATQGPPTLDFAFTTFCGDDRDLTARRLGAALRDWPGVAAVYNAGGANTGVIEVLSRHAPHVFFVGHELTDASAAALRTGVADVILDQMPEAQARRAIDLLLARLGVSDLQVENPPIRFTTITSENI